MSCLISVIVPSYNQSEFVADCLESIVRQEGAQYEILLVDGGSNDETLAIIERYRRHLAFFVSEKDRGQTDAINKGLRRAQGELVVWLNTDDFYLPGALAALAEAYDRFPTAPFYMGRGFRTDRAGITRTPFYPDGFCYSQDALVWGLNFVLQPSTGINHARLIECGGRLDESLHFTMDSDLWLRLAKLGEPRVLDHPVACSREYEQTKTSTGAWKRFAEIQRVAERHSGAPLTPGVLAELCRSLHESSALAPVSSRFPPELRDKVIELWGQAAQALTTLCGRDDGLPVR